MAEGKNLEADLVTMSTLFHLQSAQDQNQMFLPLTFDADTWRRRPITPPPSPLRRGAIIAQDPSSWSPRACPRPPA